MPIEYEMKYLKESVERSISQYSQENFAATWYAGIETKVLHMARYNVAELEKNFHDDQRSAMRELIRRGYWVKWSESEGKPMLSKDPLLSQNQWDDTKPVPNGAD